MRYLGIDFGTKKVGLALSDEAGTMGFPKEVLQNDPQLLPKIRTLIAEENVSAVVIGDSRNSDGKENTVAGSAKAFAKELELQTGMPIFWEIEAFSTQEARRGFDGTREKSAPLTDASAAALILTSYLSRHDNN